MARSDLQGLWWQDTAHVGRHGGGRDKVEAKRGRPPVPDTGWRCPKEPPNIDCAQPFAIDCETIDEGLTKGTGPGGVQREGQISGVAIAQGVDGWYFPIAHPDSVNCAWDVHAWLRDVGYRASRIVAHNALYDLEWLRAEGVAFPTAYVYCTQAAAAILDEHRLSYSLESVAQEYLGEGKSGDALYAWLAQAWGGAATRKAQGKNIGRAPPELVGPYAIDDARLTLALYRKQRPLLLGELQNVAALEFELIPLLLEMRFQGVRVNVDRAHDTSVLMRAKLAQALDALSAAAHAHVDLWSSESVGAALHKAGLNVPRTAAGGYSITSPWLTKQSHALASAVVEARQIDKLLSTFLEGYVINAARHGRVHAQFHALRSEDGGTVSGRFSSSNPNLQNIPARVDWARRALRGCFIPEDGHVWFAPDYSQIEYRILAHHAVGQGAAEVRRRYVEDPRADYHQMTTDLILDRTGVQLARAHTKNVNFGLVYGMGQSALAEFIGLGYEQGQTLFDTYHDALPFVRETFRAQERVARRTGVVRTVYGRRCSFPHWEGADGKITTTQTYGASRAHTHKALNRVLQGGAADIIKLAMRALWQEFGARLVPLVTVHDELGFSIPAGDVDTMKRIQDTMEHCIKLSVPIRVSTAQGATWGDCK